MRVCVTLSTNFAFVYIFDHVPTTRVSYCVTGELINLKLKTNKTPAQAFTPPADEKKMGSKSGYLCTTLYRCTVYRLLSEPMSTRLLNSISSRICRQNTQFNMYTTTSKQQEGCTLKDSHPKCFITTNFDKFHREAFARGGESR